ncbi:PilC/PilY family type IV pilus protein [Aquisalimonas lutea]|uniref:pilus assembly protein n=1 Tax=Aquisalimonas lutea TaxID=1327750 RepID=UPI0025B3104B|nr:PilC/PilY family type IV pilus protein [Aquisalimonas lutea]MDN3517455.1 PilC/PilY family type IV pilus protein [Aquisalimonas lutea]
MFMETIFRHRKPVTAAVLFAMVASPAYADLNLSDVPLTVNNRVAPNVFFELDDSGSMDFEMLMTPYWHYCAYDPDAPDASGNWDCDNDKITTGRWEAHYNNRNYSYIYLFENSDNVYGNNCTQWSGNGNARTCGDSFVERDWRTRSSSLNVTWFDPGFNYQPWPGHDDADFDSARSNPAESGNERDLDGFVWYEWIDDKGYSGDRPRRGTNENMTDSANGEVDLWDTRIRHEVDGDTVRRERITSSYNGDDLETSTETLTSITGTQAETLKQNIANWYQYHRRRMFVAKNAIADVIETSPGYRYGLSVLNNDHELFVEVPEESQGDFSTHDQQLREELYAFDQPNEGTPLRQALENVGEYYDGNRSGTRDPIVEACQKNFTVLFSDGYWNQSFGGVGDEDGDGHSNTLADVAKEYYNRDLSNLPNEVPPDEFDDATHQHMNTFTVAFGVEGILEDTDDDGWPNPELDDGDDWGNPTNVGDEAPEKIDDLWHAAWNARGTYVSARTPQQVIEGLRKALGNISARTSTSSSATTNSTSLDADTKAYQARFDSGDWTGELLAYELNEDGTVGEELWEAGELIDGSDRNILSVNTSGDTVFENGIDFTEWNDLSTGQQDALNQDPNGGTDGRGEERLAYLAGDQSEEGQSAGDFRVRNSLLGDIVDSNPLFVGAQDYGYSTLADDEGGDTYFSFRNGNESRRPMLYVGANDGMLHGFDADTGQEVFSYVPGGVFDNLNQLTDQDYDHQYYVNASPNAGDAFTNSSWSTILLGATGHGGNSVFALDVTNPNDMGPDDVLWEFSHEDMGRTIGQPKLGRMENGDWVAVFGNGYNSDSHQAKLYIVNLEDPTDYQVLEPDDAGSAADPNGMAAPFIADLNGNGNIDTIYAGDLHGRMWKFDVSDDSANNPDWSVAYNQGNNNLPLFEAESASGERQPITTEPEVTLDERGDVYVLFGTGKYIEEEDTTSGADPRVETLYGVKDESGGTVDRNSLTEQTIVEQLVQSGTRYRIVSENQVASNDEGWFLDLVYDGNNLGERVIFNPQLRRGRLVVTTVIPSDNPCSVGGQSWRMDLNPFSGARLEYSVYDVNGDGEINEEDFLDGENGDATGSGQGSDNFQTPPSFTSDGDGGDVSVTSQPDGPPEAQRETGGRQPIGRQSWRELLLGY